MKKIQTINRYDRFIFALKILIFEELNINLGVGGKESCLSRICVIYEFFLYDGKTFIFLN